MFKSLKVSVVLVLLALLGLAALPAYPRTETASVKLRPVKVESASTLLGENVPGEKRMPRADALTLSVPRLGLKDVRVPTSSSQADLDKAGIIRLETGGAPSEPGSNTFIVGHAIGYIGGFYPYVFYELDQMRPGDEVLLRDSTGREYVYRVYDRVIVRPEDYWVTYPVAGKTVVSLQGSYPVPTFERRLVIRAELVS
jgi:sortase A